MWDISGQFITSLFILLKGNIRQSLTGNALAEAIAVVQQN